VDAIALSGDVLALLVYTYLDHATNAMVVEANDAVDVAALVHGHGGSSGGAGGGGAGGGAMLPVWFDEANLSDYGSNWLSRHADVPSCYAPAVAAPGTAFVVLASCWLGCGLLTGAFRDENTLGCDPTHAMIVTLRAWCGTAFLVATIALGSDELLRGDHAVLSHGLAGAPPPVLDIPTYYSDDRRHEVLRAYLDVRSGGDEYARLGVPPRGGLTKADADYIFDSLSVLAFWRLFYNWMLGYRRR
jgi:hypothetical protein